MISFFFLSRFFVKMEEPTRLELAVAAMFSTYMSYQGPDNKLNKEQFLKLLKNELPLFCEVRGNHCTTSLLMTPIAKLGLFWCP